MFAPRVFFLYLLNLGLRTTNGLTTFGKSQVNRPTVIWALARDPNLTQFAPSVRRSDKAKDFLAYHQMTIFAPIDANFHNYNEAWTDSHLSKTHINFDHSDYLFKDSNYIPMESVSGAPLWVRRMTDDDDGEEQFWVNNARIYQQSKVECISRPDYLGKAQVLYKIDEILRESPPMKSGQTVYDFMASPSTPLKSYHRGVITAHLENQLKYSKTRTYFMIYDHQLEVNQTVSQDLIKCGIIDGQVLFTRPTITQRVQKYNSLNPSCRWSIVNSRQVLLTDSQNKKHLLTLEQKDISLSNGVLHILSKLPPIFLEKPKHKFPFVSIKDKLESDYEMQIFSGLFSTIGFSLSKLNNVTVLAPDDAAWLNFMEERGLMLEDLQRIPNLEEMLARHVIAGVYSAKALSRGPMYLPLMMRNSSDAVNVNVRDDRGEMFLEWSTLKIPIKRSNYECTDGILHVIGRPLFFDSEVSNNKSNSKLFKAWNALKQFTV